MATLYITSQTGDETVEGSIFNCIANAQSGDVIELADSFPADMVVHLKTNGKQIYIDKDLTIRAGNNRVIYVDYCESRDRLLRFVGTSSSSITVDLEDIWFEGFKTTATLVGAVHVNYADVTMTRCVFANITSSSSTAGLYAANGSVTMSACVVSVTAGNAINYANAAEMNIENSTIVGTMKSGTFALDSINLVQSAVETHIVDAEKMNWSLKPTSIFASGRTEEGKDLYDNDYVEDGALGALELQQAYDGVTASFFENHIEFSGGTGNRALAYSLEQEGKTYLPFAFTTASRPIPTAHTEPGFHVLVGVDDGFETLTVSAGLDEEWLRLCFSAIDVPLQTSEEMKTFSVNIASYFKKPEGV